MLIANNSGLQTTRLRDMVSLTKGLEWRSHLAAILRRVCFVLQNPVNTVMLGTGSPTLDLWRILQ